jgi:hypothetical protein
MHFSYWWNDCQELRSSFVNISASDGGVTIVLVKTLAENQKTIPRSKMRFRIECSLACDSVLPFK